MYIMRSVNTKFHKRAYKRLKKVQTRKQISFFAIACYVPFSSGFLNVE